MSRAHHWVLTAAAACLFMAGASADVIYKVRLKDGSIAFTDRPPPGATVLEKREFDATAPAPATASPATRTTPTATRKSEGAAVDERLRKREAEFDQKNAAVATAERALAEARANLEKGREPQEGDLLANVPRKGAKGVLERTTRRSPAFDERIQALEQAVAAAEARLTKAIEERNAVR